MLTKEDVEHVADLARINLTQDEIIKYQAQLGAILNYMEKLKEVSVDNLETEDNANNLENVWRNDEQKLRNKEIEKLTELELINMAPEVQSGQVKVKSVF